VRTEFWSWYALNMQRKKERRHMNSAMSIYRNKNSRVVLAEDTGANCARTGYGRGNRSAFGVGRKHPQTVVAFLAMTVVAILSGCSASSSTKPAVGSIILSDANGVQQKKAPTSLTVNNGTYLYVNVTNDKQFLGVDWTVYCGSQLPPGAPLPVGQPVDTSCGTFTPVHTLSGPVPDYTKNASGIVTFYTAPAAPPKSGVVTLYASATSDHTKYSSYTLTIIGLPITIAFATTPPSSLAVNGTVSLNALVSNDYSSGGVNWSVACASSDCGSFSAAQTASGATTTYTAPASVPAGQTVTVIATSATDSTKSISATINILSSTSSAVRGRVMAGSQPVEGASVLLYAAGQSGYKSSSTLLNTSGNTTDKDGSFSLAGIGGNCPNPQSQVYLVAKGGATPENSNQNLALMTALGSCESLGSVGEVTINEVTTVGSVYALSGFMSDAAHVGTTTTNTSGLVNAFSVANNLVNMATGEARSVTATGNGAAPQAKINSIANALNRCSASGDASSCGNATGSSAPDTLQSALYLAQHLVDPPSDSAKTEALWQMAGSDGPFQPALAVAPKDWSLALDYTSSGIGAVQAIAFDQSGNAWIAGSSGVAKFNSVGVQAPNSPFTDAALSGGKSLAIDNTGNAWVINDGTAGSVIEFDSHGNVLSPQSGYTNGITHPSSISADGSGNVWVGNVEGAVNELSGKDGSLLRSMTVPTSRTSDDLYEGAVVEDGSGHVWRNDASGKDVLPSHSNVSGDLPSSGVTPPTIAIDQSGNLWVLNKNDNTVSEFVGVTVAPPTPLQDTVGKR
jgi:hypothetical protein